MSVKVIIQRTNRPTNYLDDVSVNGSIGVSRSRLRFWKGSTIVDFSFCHLTLLLVGFLEYVNPAGGGGGICLPPFSFSVITLKRVAIATQNFV